MQMSNKKIIPHYGSRVAVLPIPAETQTFREATREQLAVLIALMAEGTFSYFAIAERSGATRAQIDEAIAYWEAAGVIHVEQVEKEESAPAQSAPDPSRKTLERAAQLPHYNTEQTARFLEENPSAAVLIDCCQQELGKIFSPAESEIIIGLSDYLSLGAEYILLLCAYCGKKGRKSLRYIEKTAITLHDAGIVGYEQLELHLRKLDMAGEAEHQLRELFGIGSRALVKREREAFFRWISEWEMPFDVIAHAYEITVNRTGGPSVPYTNAILEKWHAEGLLTLESVEEAENARKNDAALAVGSSFDTEDFLDLALQRSYGSGVSGKETKK